MRAPSAFVCQHAARLAAMQLAVSRATALTLLRTALSRAAGSEIFTDLATFENFAPLKSKGIDGGSYTYLDDTVPSPGTWVYRIQDCDRTGKRSRVCQKLVEIDSQSEQTFTLAVGGVLALAALALVAAGISADPIQTTAAGRGGGFF